MEAIKNLELIKELINGYIYGFDYNLRLNSILIKVQVISYYEKRVRRIKFCELKLSEVAKIDYFVLEKSFGVAKIIAFNISEGKYKDKLWGEEENVYDVNIKIWNDELNVKCRNVIINLVSDQKF